MHQSSRLLSKTPALLVLKAIKGLTALTVKVIQVCYRDKLELRFQLLPSKTTYNIPSHMADINECSMQGVCQNGDCLNTLGSFKCSCKAGWVLERNGCVGECLAQFHPILGSSCTNWNPPSPPSLSAPSDLEAPAEQGQCYRIVSESRGCEHALPTYLTQVVCCCTVGKAWGPNCEPCPQMGTGEHGEAGRRSRRDLFQFLLLSLKCCFKARLNIFFHSNELLFFLPVVLSGLQ